MKPSLDDLALLIAIADQRGFSAAARALGIPKSTVSRRLSELEDQLQTSLFRRSTRALSLTEAGTRIYELAKPAIDAAEDAALTIAELESAVTGTVSITTTAALGQYLVAPRLIDLKARHPRLRFELRLTERRVDIVWDGIDLAIRMGELQDSELVSRRLAQVNRLMVASPDYLADAGIPSHPSDLSAHEAIPTNAALDTWRFADGWECTVRWTLAAGNMFVARDLCLAGMGIALLPEFMIEDELRSGLLTGLMPDHPIAQADAWIVSSKQRYRSPAIRAVMDAFVAPSKL